MKLLRAEWRRLFARRFTKIMLLGVLLVLAGVGTTVVFSSHKHNAATYAAAQRDAQRIAAMNEQTAERCRQSQANGSDPTGEFPPGIDCAQFSSYTPDPQDLQPHEYSYRHETEDLLVLLAALLTLFAFAVGASYIGAEWSSGGLMNLLLWRPQRLRLMLGKLTALLLGVGTVAVILSAAWLAGLYGIARWRGNTAGTTAGLIRSLGLTDLRALVLVLGAATLGFALASVGRHTVTALGVAIGWLVVFEFGLRLVLDFAGVHRPERFVLSSYVTAWLTKAAHFTDYSGCDNNATMCTPVNWSVHMNQSAGLLGAILLVILAWALVAFRRRDIS